MTDKPHPRHFAVVGAGIVGVCCALQLQRDGHRVSLFDYQGPGEGTSRGNAAVIAGGACEPIAMPGILGRVPGMLMDPLGPLAIRWRYLPRLAPWLVRFVAASRPHRVEEISKALRELSSRCVAAFRPLTEAAGIADMIRDTGWLSVYKTESSFQLARGELDLQQRRGIKFDVLTGDQILQMEPALAPIFARGVYFPENSVTVNNFRLVQCLAEDFIARGGRVLRERATDVVLGPQGPRELITEQGRHSIDAIVVAAGAWSRDLARRLGHRVPLDTERGYHIMLPDPGVMPRMPVHIGDHGFVATPLEHGLRFAGTVELGGLQAPPNWERANVLLRHGRSVFPGLREDGADRWMGFRPSFPDSLPVISGSPRTANAYFAFGHGHLGLSFAAITGKIVADLASGRGSGFDLAPYRIDRW